MAKSFATLIDEIQSDLGDDTTTYTDAKVTIQLEKAIKAVSDYKPYVIMLSYFLETRTGTATTDTANALVDSQAQFLSTDVDKVIYNTDDNTWAVVTAYVSATQLTLSKDIMEDGDESYKMFNKGCWDVQQINIEDVTDYLGEDRGVIAVEYKIQRSAGNYLALGRILDSPITKAVRNYRNFTVEGDILTIDIDFTLPDSADSDADVEVFVWFETRQRVSQLTVLAGAINNGNLTVGTTTISVDGLSGTEVVTEGTLLTIAGIRGTYMVTADKTLSSGGGDLVIFPGLLDVIEDGDVVTIIGSTLSSRLERLAVELGAAYCALSLQANAISKGGQGVYRRYEGKLAIAFSELERLREPKSKHTWPKD